MANYKTFYHSPLCSLTRNRLGRTKAARSEANKTICEFLFRSRWKEERNAKCRQDEDALESIKDFLFRATLMRRQEQKSETNDLFQRWTGVERKKSFSSSAFVLTQSAHEKQV